jgi:glutaconyl-CoA/methylmalonyl-CoA decarboxylase subunit gamma
MKEYKYTIDGKEYDVQIGDIVENTADVTVNGEPFKVEMTPEEEPEKKKVTLGQPAAAEAGSEEGTTPATGANAANAIKAPLPGTIIEVSVNVGDEVKAGDTVVVLEAMKMANNIEAEKDGKVTAVFVKTGQAVMEEAPLVVVE